MAPVSGTVTLSGTATALPFGPQATSPVEFAGDEFSNNLFSDLAPLLALFGEQVTKQFMSMSLGWADNILLAVGPLGILTAVVSAIRVGGVRFLKALIGRARENQATAEQELLSSTSKDVSELWNGTEIVRQPGHAMIKEFVVYREGEHANQNNQEGVSDVHIGDLDEACNNDWLEEKPGKKPSRLLQRFADKLGIEPRSPEPLSSRELSEQPPNIALNVHKASATDEELWVFAVLGTILQVIALVVPALLTYHWKLNKGDAAIQSYAYPTFLTGSCLMIIGIAICSHIIEATTVEQNFQPKSLNADRVKAIFRLQMACSMGDQEYRPYIIFNDDNNKRIRTSRPVPENSNFLRGKDVRHIKTVLAVSSSVIGFICQFIGLRALHWSVSIIQLGVTLLNTAMRSYVRRGLANTPKCAELDDSNLDRIAICVGAACASDRLSDLPDDGKIWRGPIPRFELCTGGYGFVIPTSQMETHDLQILQQRLVLTLNQYKFDHTCQVICKTANDGFHVRPWSFWNSSLVGTLFNPPSMTTSDPRIALRHSLQTYATEENGRVMHLADCLFEAMEHSLSLIKQYVKENLLDTDIPIDDIRFYWTHLVENTEAVYSRLELSYSKYDSPGIVRLHAILALWTYSLDQRDTTALIAAERTERDEAIKGRYQRPFQERQGFIRFLQKYAPNEIEAGLAELKNWTGNQKIRRTVATSESQFGNLVEPSSPCWPVFGVSLSHMESCATPTTTQPAACDVFVAVELPYDIATQCALEIFSGFIDAVAEQIIQLRGVRKASDPVDVQMGICFWHPWLKRIAQTLVEFGIVNDIRDAYTIVIPPFARRGKLRIDAVVGQTVGN